MNVIKEIERITALELDNGIIGGITNGSWHEEYRKSSWVYVGGMPYELTEGDIICVMSQWGEIEDINLVRDKDTNKSLGYAFIKYEDYRSTILAVDNFNGIRLLNRVLRVDHVNQYKLPKDIRKKEEELLESNPDTNLDIGPGHAYKHKQLENQYDINKGIDIWSKPSSSSSSSTLNDSQKNISTSEKYGIIENDIIDQYTDQKNNKTHKHKDKEHKHKKKHKNDKDDKKKSNNDYKNSKRSRSNSVDEYRFRGHDRSSHRDSSRSRSRSRNNNRRRSNSRDRDNIAKTTYNDGRDRKESSYNNSNKSQSVNTTSATSVSYAPGQALSWRGTLDPVYQKTSTSTFTGSTGNSSSGQADNKKIPSGLFKTKPERDINSKSYGGMNRRR